MSCKLRKSILRCLLFFWNYPGWDSTGSYLSCPTVHLSVNDGPSFIDSCNRLCYMIILLYKRRRCTVCFEIYSITLLAMTSTSKGKVLVLCPSMPDIHWLFGLLKRYPGAVILMLTYGYEGCYFFWCEILADIRFLSPRSRRSIRSTGRATYAIRRRIRSILFDWHISLASVCFHLSITPPLIYQE